MEIVEFLKKIAPSRYTNWTNIRKCDTRNIKKILILMNFRKAAQLLKPMGQYLSEDMKFSKDSGVNTLEKDLQMWKYEASEQ